MCLLNDFDNSEINIELKLTNHFEPMCAMTVHKAQGMTINRPYSIYEYNRMQHDMLYVALTRTSKKEYVNFCGIDLLKPYTGYVYRYSINGSEEKTTKQIQLTSLEEQYRDTVINNLNLKY